MTNVFLVTVKFNFMQMKRLDELQQFNRRRLRELGLPGLNEKSSLIAIKGPLKCLETRSIIQCVDVISTETGWQGGAYQKAPPLF